MLAVRRHNRSPLKTPLEFTRDDPKQVTFGFAKDISVGGMCVETEFPAPPRSQVVLCMTLPGLSEPMILAGVVRWRRSNGMGVRFVSLGASEASAIAELVTQWDEQWGAGASPVVLSRSA
jgi:uncharacterized protein (TIGR02266 family)